MKRQEMLIPESVLIKVFNQTTGAECKTIEEICAYLEAHPDAREHLELGPLISKLKQ